MSFTDALSRISEIQQQISSLSSPLSAASASAASTATADSAGSTDSSAFASALAQAQTGTSGSSDALSALASLTGLAGNAATTGSGAASASTASGSSTGVTLPAGASELTSDQRQFASTLVADTGLNPGVVTSWLLAEENGSAAQSRQSANNNDWLNIGYTDSATIGAGDSIWSDPTSAANATAQWLKGQDSIPGYGTASSGVQSILDSVGQSPSAQISALQNSGWASSGYPDLASLYQQVVGTAAGSDITSLSPTTGTTTADTGGASL